MRYRLAELLSLPSDTSVTLSLLGENAVRESVGLRDFGELLFDRIGGATCCFMRLNCLASRQMILEVPGPYRIDSCPSGGWLLSTSEPEKPTYWFPLSPMLREVDSVGHIRVEVSVAIVSLQASPEGLSFGIQADPAADAVIDCVVWEFTPRSSTLAAQLESLTALETQPYFLWGTHNHYGSPSDVYTHLIHGHVYEHRFSWPKYWKICSENDAHCLSVTLTGLEKATGKSIYGMLKAQLLLSVISRQWPDGGWRHGEWTDRMESHYRQHCSAMHMLMDALVEREDPVVRSSLERGAAFLSRQIDELDAGMWFLHDELEHRVETMRDGPFRWIPSRALGKSETNMLVLNSHLDATVALDRFAQVTGDSRYRPLVAKAKQATRAALGMRPAEWLYRQMYKAVRWTFLPTAQAVQLAWHQRAFKRLAWKYLIPMLPHIKARLPRLAMPGGYIERELSLKIFAHEYLPINLMDLLRYRRQFQDDSVDAVIGAGFELIDECCMLDRWPEINGRGYAVGFLAEALYHACLLYTEARYRIWLAQAVIKLQILALGLPPSLLGANGEAVAPEDRTPTPLVDDGRVCVVNLCRKNAREFLLVNASTEVARLQIVRNKPSELVWTTGSNGDRLDGLPMQLPAGTWLWGRGQEQCVAAD